jgi:glycosyltransferase involved in cell wall biosynthesis
MVRYTIAVCNYNMDKTLERSLRSMLGQTDERFEVVCVDGGSTDQSVSILESLANDYDRLRIDCRPPDPERHLGADRNHSFELADGEYILESFDCDNKYYEIIDGLVDIYHQLESGHDDLFLLSAMGVSIAPRELVREIPYRNLGGAEDRDWYRRLAAANAVRWLRRTGPIKDQIGYYKGAKWQISRDIEGKICDFQSGVPFWSAMRWAVSTNHAYIYEQPRSAPATVAKRCYDILTFPYAYVRSQRREQYDPPIKFNRKGEIGRLIDQRRSTARELAKRMNIDLDCSNLNEASYRAFCDDI